MKISIAMATYNGAEYIKEQLDSFVAQTRQPDELVICDDNSSDETLAIIKCFAEIAPFPVIWNQNDINLGYAGNFNEALMRTTGELVFMSDQDDVWFPEKIERIEQEAARSKALVFINDAALTNKNLRDLKLTKQGQFRSGGLSLDNFVMGCCVAAKRELLDVCLPIPPSFPAHDAWIVRFSDELKRKAIVPDILQWYRRHDENESKILVNRTKRLSKRAVKAQQTKELLAILAGEPNTSNIEWENNLRLLHEASFRAPIESCSFLPDLERMRLSLERRVTICDYREEVRRQPLHRRIVSIIRLWNDGGYKLCGGVKSLLRDIRA